MQQIFISYSRRNLGFVRRLAGDLKDAGYDVWWDISDLRGGDDWVRIVPEAIDASEFFLVVLSPQSAVSEWVRREYTQALHRRKRIIPLMLARTTMPFSMNTLNYIDFTAEEKYASSFNALLAALEYPGDLPGVPATGLPHFLGRYIIPIMLVVFLLLPLVALLILRPFLPSPPASSTPVLTHTAAATNSLTLTLTPAPTQTAAAEQTDTPLSTRTPAFQRLTFCVNSRSVNSINVRSGPGSDHARIGEPLPVGSCLDFRAQNEEGTWLLIAPNQADPFLRQYEGGWIFRELLGLGSEGPIDLPAVTLTPTATASPSQTPSHTPTRTPAFPPTRTGTPTP